MWWFGFRNISILEIRVLFIKIVDSVGERHV